MKLNAHFGNYERPTDTPGHREVSLPVNIRFYRISSLFRTYFPTFFPSTRFRFPSVSVCSVFRGWLKYGVLIAAVFSYFLVCF